MDGVVRKRYYKVWAGDPKYPVPYRTRKRWEKRSGEALDTHNMEMELQLRCDANIEGGNYEFFKIADGGADLPFDCTDTSTDVVSTDVSLSRDLYQGSTVSVDETVLSLLNLYVNRKVSKATLTHILDFSIPLLPPANKMPKSLYRLFQYVQDLAPQNIAVQHFYCKNCCFYCGELPLEACLACQSDAQCGFFLEFDVAKQIKDLLEYQNLALILESNLPVMHSRANHELNVIKDITYGSEYQRVNAERRTYDLTLILNTDGIALKKSSSADLWLLLATFAEVPEHLRESFIIMLGVWYDKRKPVMNTFLRPFACKIKECSLEAGGLTWTHPLSKTMCKTNISAPLIVADAPARAQVQNILNFNGKFGCNICEIRTSNARRIEGKKSVNVYKFNANGHVFRTKERMMRQAKRADLLDVAHVKGVKGQSVVSILPGLDISTAFVPEFMHSVCLGVARQFLTLWVEKPGPWSLKPHIASINAFLRSVQPPDVFSRMPRSLLECKKWKAHEFYCWLLFYSIPSVEPYMPIDYMQHWLCLVISIFFLCQKEVNQTEIKMAEGLLELFVGDIDRLYGDRELTYNVHQLLHLPLCVRRWGPLWAHAAFMFESFNGFISRMIHGSKHVSQEISKNLTLYRGFNILKYRTNGIQSQKLNSRLPVAVGSRSSLSDVKLTHTELNYLRGELTLENVDVYMRINVRGEVFTSSTYKDDELKTNSYTVFCTGADSGNHAGTVRFFIKSDDCMYVFLDQFKVQHHKMLSHNETMIKVPHLLPIEEGGNAIILRLDNLTSFVKLVRVGTYACRRPNVMRKVL